VELRDYLNIAAKRWRLVAVFTVLGLAAAIAATVAATPIYQAQTQLFVSAQLGASDISQLAQGSTFTQQRVKSYGDVVDSPRVTKPVVDQLDLPFSADGLAGRISASTPLDTVLINIDVTDESPTRAARIANAVASQSVRVISELESAPDARQSPVRVSVLREADVAAEPVSPRRTVNLALGLLIGLAIGIGAAVLREMLDTTVKPDDDLADLGDVSVLGRIAYDPDARKHPLVVQADPQGARAEAFRQLRTSLQFVDIDRKPRSIVVTSSLPSEGKSTTAANLALTLAEAGLRVILVEGDLRRPTLSEYLGLEGAAGLTTVLVGNASLSDVLQPWGDGNLNVLPTGPIPPNPSELLGSQHMLKLLEQLDGMADIVLIDAPPLLPVTDAAVLSALADGALVVCRVGKTRREELRRAVKALRGVDARLLGIVLNMTPAKRSDGYSYRYSTAPAITTARRKRASEKQPANGVAACVNVTPDEKTAAAAGMRIVSGSP